MLQFFSPESKATQEYLSSPARRLLDYVDEHPHFLERASFEPLFASIYRICKPLGPPGQKDVIQPWPILLSPEREGELATAGIELARIHRDIPRRFFADDYAKIAEFYGLKSKTIVAMLLSEPSDVEINLCRGDFIDTPTGLKCIECNFGTVSGFQFAAYAKAYLEDPEIQAFLAAKGISVVFSDPIRAMMRHVVKDCVGRPIAAGGVLNALVVASDTPFAAPDTQPLEHFRSTYKSALEELGDGLDGVLDVVPAAQVEIKNRQVQVRGRRYHAVIDQSGAPGRLLPVFKGGYIRLYTGPVGEVILGDKRNLALMSEHCESDRFDDRERDLIRAYVPWTRLALDGETEFGGTTSTMRELLIEKRERMVLKAGASFGGQDVHIGRFEAPDRWREVVDTACAGPGWIAQEFLDQRPYVFQNGERGACPHDVVWGSFVFDDVYGGLLVRMAPRAESAILNVKQGARVATAFEARVT